ncbi:hypothetical protein CCR75_004170 [Bremia lactucae]|uniref:Uncharacterized protein n=1 Tax=Bremia lactucae TaxID=4779 RepID=A0A976IEI8_BRELC|nr:hypothetical protein CCR75_004170 [Bremia lactucae]
MVECEIEFGAYQLRETGLAFIPPVLSSVLSSIIMPSSFQFIQSRNDAIAHPTAAIHRYGIQPVSVPQQRHRLNRRAAEVTGTIPDFSDVGKHISSNLAFEQIQKKLET